MNHAKFIAPGLDFHPSSRRRPWFNFRAVFNDKFSGFMGKQVDIEIEANLSNSRVSEGMELGHDRFSLFQQPDMVEVLDGIGQRQNGADRIAEAANAGIFGNGDALPENSRVFCALSKRNKKGGQDDEAG
jgi:hypothetical protein